MHCKHCGAQILQDGKFCTRCGSPLNLQEQHSTQLPEENRRGKVLSIVLTVALAVLAIVCVLLLIFTGGRNRNESLWQEQYDLGVRYLSEGKYEEAAIAFCAAIDIDPKRSDAYLGAVEAYVALGDVDSAIDILKKGVQQTEDDALKNRQQMLEAEQQEPDSPPEEPVQDAPTEEAPVEETTEETRFTESDLVGEWTCYVQTDSIWDFFDLFLYEDGTATAQWSTAWSEGWYMYDGTWRIVEMYGDEVVVELSMVGGNYDMETGLEHNSYKSKLLVRPEGDQMYVSLYSGDGLALYYDAYYRRDLSHEDWYTQHSP